MPISEACREDCISSALVMTIQIWQDGTAYLVGALFSISTLHTGRGHSLLLGPGSGVRTAIRQERGGLPGQRGVPMSLYCLVPFLCQAPFPFQFPQALPLSCCPGTRQKLRLKCPSPPRLSLPR